MIRKLIALVTLVVWLGGCKPEAARVSNESLIQILEAEDTRRWDGAAMETHLKDTDPKIRARAALAAGRIGESAAIPRLAGILQNDSSETVAASAAFAIGEIESA